MSLHLASLATPACLLEEGGDKGIGFAVAVPAGQSTRTKTFSPSPPGLTNIASVELSAREGEDQCRQVFHMVEIQSDDLAVCFDRTRLMSALEYPRRGEPRQSALQLPASSARPSASAVR